MAQPLFLQDVEGALLHGPRGFDDVEVGLVGALRLLTEQVERERELRGEAETRVASESGRREFWATLTVVTGMLAVALFLVGTAIGSKGRRHAESA